MDCAVLGLVPGKCWSPCLAPRRSQWEPRLSFALSLWLSFFLQIFVFLRAWGRVPLLVFSWPKGKKGGSPPSLTLLLACMLGVWGRGEHAPPPSLCASALRHCLCLRRLEIRKGVDTRLVIALRGRGPRNTMKAGKPPTHFSSQVSCLSPDKFVSSWALGKEKWQERSERSVVSLGRDTVFRDSAARGRLLHPRIERSERYSWIVSLRFRLETTETFEMAQRPVWIRLVKEAPAGHLVLAQQLETRQGGGAFEHPAVKPETRWVH